MEESKKNNEFVIQKCKTCGRHKAFDGSFVSGAVESGSFTDVCLSYIQPPEPIERVSYIYNNFHARTFALATQLSESGQTKVSWFSFEETQCPDCERYASLQIDPSWSSVVELSATDNVLPLLWLEQQIQTSKMNQTASEFHIEDGKYFFSFNHKPSAFRFVAFIRSLLAVKIEEENMCQGYTSNEIPVNLLVYHVSCPGMWKDDVINENGQYLLCVKASSDFTFVDVQTCKTVVKTADEYWKEQPKPISKSFLKICCVEEIHPIGTKVGRYQKSDILVSCESSFFAGKCHFSIESGANCLCYCLDDIMIPVREVINGRFNWYVKTLGTEPTEELLKILENDPELRNGVTLFSKEDIPSKSIEELVSTISGLSIESK